MWDTWTRRPLPPPSTAPLRAEAQPPSAARALGQRPQARPLPPGEGPQPPRPGESEEQRLRTGFCVPTGTVWTGGWGLF